MNTKSVKPASRVEIVAAENAAWARSRIAILDARLGEGIGALRERKRLTKHLGGAK